MLAIPFKVDDTATEFEMFIVFEQDNIDRIRRQDPAMITLTDYEPCMGGAKCRRIHISYVNAADSKALRLLITAKDVRAIIRLLTRGFEVRPDDHDRPSVSLL
jgi:hypothetical protein